jgi:hypothetical protein
MLRNQLRVGPHADAARACGLSNLTRITVGKRVIEFQKGAYSISRMKRP